MYMITHAKTYTLKIERHDGLYVAYFPALPGCNTQAASYEQAVVNAEEALALYIDTLEAHGDPIPVEHPSSELVSLGVTLRRAAIA